MMDKEIHIKEYISECFLEGKTPADYPVLAEWLAVSEQNRLEFEEYRKIWNKTRKLYQLKQFDTSAAWKKVDESNLKKSFSKQRVNNVIYMVSGIAATVLLFVVFSISGFFSRSSVSEYAIQMKTEYGNRSQIVLPDGSEVHLNAGSFITYSYDQEKNIREVKFSGEGFFNISKNTAPFIITTSEDFQIKVLGTTFNLTSYEDDHYIETTLVEGSVELLVSGEKLNMSTGETVTYNKSTGKATYSDKSVVYASGWLNDNIYMEDLSLSQVCKLLERRYNVHITLEDGIGETIRYNGLLREETIIEVMDALQTLSGIKYRMKGKSIFITSR